MSRATGRLIVLEGSEGVGKTTQLARLSDALRIAGYVATTVREPGGTSLGDEVRRLLLQPGADVVPEAEALLFMASRAQLVARIVRPAIAAGQVVLLDRFFLSTYAYQVAGRGLPAERVRAANLLATGGLTPDLTMVLTLPAGEGLRRASERGLADRLEGEARSFHQKVERAFAESLQPDWQRTHPECGIIVDVDGRGTPDEVSVRVRQVVSDRWPETFPPAGVSHPR